MMDHVLLMFNIAQLRNVQAIFLINVITVSAFLIRNSVIVKTVVHIIKNTNVRMAFVYMILKLVHKITLLLVKMKMTIYVLMDLA